MLSLRVFGAEPAITSAGEALEQTDGVRHLTRTPALRGEGRALIMAEVRPDAADLVLERVLATGIPAEDVTIARLEAIAPLGSRPGDGGLVWADLVGLARRNARLIARYLVLMAVAGVIAGFGVIEVNQTLIVGAMAVSPDTLPIAAACIALVSRRPRLAGRAVVTLAAGLAVTGASATVLTVLLDALSLLPAGYQLGNQALSGLDTVNVATIVVAFVAGVAALLALETRASSAVGVAISVTTIPAAAYLGVALGVGEGDTALGALAVLALNVVMLLLGGSLTLLVQRALARHGAAHGNGTDGLRAATGAGP